jgi:hypothetical protein
LHEATLRAAYQREPEHRRSLIALRHKLRRAFIEEGWLPPPEGAATVIKFPRRDEWLGGICAARTPRL